MALSDQIRSIPRHWGSPGWIFTYGFAVIAAWVALSLWAISPLMHDAPFSLFVAAVVFTARFAGFGPALLCTGVSALFLDYFVFSPHFAFSTSAADLQRLMVFLGISIVVGSLARQRTQAERKAEQTLQQMAAIVESSEDAIFSTRPDGTITSWNRGAEALYQYSADEAVGQYVTLIAPPERIGEVEQNRARLNRGESVASYQTERMRRDGTRVSVMISISPLRNAKGEIIGASAIARDISAQKRSEEALRRSEKLATAGRLAASIAHEINNPLEAVTNLIYLARHDPKNATQHLEMAERELARVAHIAQQTLGFVRESSGATSLDVGSVLDEVLQLYSSKLLKKHIRVQKRFRSACIHAHSGELRQLFSNLMVNAVDAMSPGGCLWLRVAPGQEYSSPGRAGVRVVVADNGSGISPEHFEHLFEPFYTTKKEAGTGLGLWLSLGIVRKHGGSIRVRSRAKAGESGTVFSIFLPEIIESPKAA
jgi:PAS domain S-box-containing protein